MRSTWIYSVAQSRSIGASECALCWRTKLGTESERSGGFSGGTSTLHEARSSGGPRMRRLGSSTSRRLPKRLAQL